MILGKGTLNKVMLIGRLGKDPELKYTPASIAVANFNIATNMVWKDQQGNQQERTHWHRIVLWRRLAEIAGEYLKKGSRVYIEGRLETRSYQDKDGVTRYITEVVADNMMMLDSAGAREAAAEAPPAPQPTPEFEDMGPAEADDLPF